MQPTVFKTFELRTIQLLSNFFCFCNPEVTFTQPKCWKASIIIDLYLYFEHFECNSELKKSRASCCFKMKKWSLSNTQVQYGGLSILKLFQITCKSFDFMPISNSLPLLDSRSIETHKLFPVQWKLLSF